MRRAQEHPERVAEWLLVEWPEGEAEPTKYGWRCWIPGRPVSNESLLLEEAMKP